MTLKANGWKEVYIAIWEHELFNHTFDTNTGGVFVFDLDGNYIDSILPKAGQWEKAAFVTAYNDVAYRADQPF
jgi:hypothetical protein